MITAAGAGSAAAITINAVAQPIHPLKGFLGGNRGYVRGVIELIGVPFDGYGRPGSQASAAAVLRGAGLAGAIVGREVVDSGDLELPEPEPERGRDTGLINEPALVAMTDALGRRVEAAVSAGRVALVFGGDCSLLFGVISGLRDLGLLFVDGHEDTMPLDVSEDGEAANVEVGLLLGVTGGLLRGPLLKCRGILAREKLAMLGQRDLEWRRRFNVGSLSDSGVFLRGLSDVSADPAAISRDAVAHLSQHADGWWLHTDLDVLDPVEFASQGLPEVEDDPGGLTWAQLTTLLVAAVQAGGCLGWSLVIYDPEQDADRADARRIVKLVSDVTTALP